MTTLQIRDLDPTIYRALSRRAKREHRSLARQAAMLLEEALLAPSDGRARRGDLLATIDEDLPTRWPQDLPAPEQLITQDRQR